jgi:hypothetical protein
MATKQANKFKDDGNDAFKKGNYITPNRLLLTDPSS